MAITVVQSKTGGSFPLSFTSPATAGNTVFLIAGAFTTSALVISSSAPTLGGSSVAGAQALFSPGGVNGVDSPLNGNNGVYFTIWMLPNIPGGATAVSMTLTNGGYTGALAIEVSGLGASPVPDKSHNAGNASTSAIDSGASGAITTAPELILGAAQAFQGASTDPGGWTSLSPSGNTRAGYQIPVSPGGSYDWAQTANSAGNPWCAGVATIAAFLPSPPPPVLISQRAGLY